MDPLSPGVPMSARVYFHNYWRDTDMYITCLCILHSITQNLDLIRQLTIVRPSCCGASLLWVGINIGYGFSEGFTKKYYLINPQLNELYG